MKNIVKKIEKLITGGFNSREKAEKAISELKKTGKITAKEGKNLLSDIMKETHSAQVRVSKLIDRHLSMAVKQLKGSEKKIKRIVRK